jgi:hypothetical protein
VAPWLADPAELRAFLLGGGVFAPLAFILM